MSGTGKKNKEHFGLISMFLKDDDCKINVFVVGNL